MRGNRIPREPDKLLSMGGRMIGGLRALEAELGITGTSAAALQALHDDYTAASAATGCAKAAKREAADAFQQADEAVTAFIIQTKKVLSCYLGNRWTTSWGSAGFPDFSTEIPRQQVQRWALCGALKLYFERTPEHEAPALGVTAAKAGELHTAICAARAQVNKSITELDGQLKARAAALRKLTQEMHSTLEMLPCHLPDDDPRWHRFGLTAPADPHVPERVESLALKAVGQGNLEVVWPRAARATRYRLYVQRLGQDPEPIPRKPVYDTRALLSGFAPGTTVRIHILAANATGEAAPSPVEEVLME